MSELFSDGEDCNELGWGIVRTDEKRLCRVCGVDSTDLGAYVADGDDYDPEWGWPADLEYRFEERGDIYAAVCERCQGNIVWGMTKASLFETFVDRFMEGTLSTSSKLKASLNAFVKWWEDEGSWADLTQGQIKAIFDPKMKPEP